MTLELDATAIAALGAPPEQPDNPASRSIQSVLQAIRTHLDMDVAFVAEFANGRRFFRHVDSRGADSPVATGGSDPLSDTFCHRVVEGRLPELIADAALLPEARTLPVTQALPVGAHLSVPIQLCDGRCYGTFCCFSHTPDHSLNQRDLQLMRVLAALVAEQIDREQESVRVQDDARERIQAVLAANVLTTVYQPIVGLAQDRIVGFEALSRFGGTPQRTPDVWFNEAGRVGLGVELETLAITRAVRGLRQLPGDMYLTLNVSPNTLLHGDIERILADCPLERIVVEVTEHSVIEHYRELALVVAPLRDRGLRIAVDDAGAGYASFKHVLSLAPDIIKLDMSITRAIDTDRARFALAAALVRFAEETGSRIVAEGVENEAELTTLRRLGVDQAQGYFLGRPVAIEAAAAMGRTAIRQLV